MLWLWTETSSVADIGSCASHEIGAFRALFRSQHTTNIIPRDCQGRPTITTRAQVLLHIQVTPLALGPAWELTQQTLNKNEQARKSSVVIIGSTLILVGDAVRR